MDLLAAIKREERKLEKESGKLQLSGVRAAAKALGSKAGREITEVKKRVMSAAARAKISRGLKARWLRFDKRRKLQRLAMPRRPLLQAAACTDATLHPRHEYRRTICRKT
jgi:hypothetical protein